MKPQWKVEFPNLEKFMVLEVAPVAPNLKGMIYIDSLTQIYKVDGHTGIANKLREIAIEIPDENVVKKIRAWADFVDPFRKSATTEPGLEPLESPDLISSQEFNELVPDESPEEEDDEW